MSVASREALFFVETLDYVELSETELVRLAKEGQRAAFAELDRRHRDKLVNYIARRVGSRHDADDIAQEAMLRAFQKIRQQSGRRGFSSWLFAIALRAIADFTRARRETALLACEDIAGRGSCDPAHITQERESQDNLFQLAARLLTDRQFNAVWMRYVDDLSIDEIATQMGCTRVSVRVTLYRARCKLMPYLKGESP